MHATSLQGFDYGDVVHQFEKRCIYSNLISFVAKIPLLFREQGTGNRE
ncbi:MAG: hypothetical protein O4753_12415 [Trichodesmium sp. St7_bin2_1]|nr:hypothetical protein [Trichodesmium sp. St7_bin2_1]